MNIQNNIKQYMKVIGITQVKLAEGLDLEKMKLSRMLTSGKKSMNIDDLKMISDFFSVDKSFFDSEDFDPSIVLGNNETKMEIEFSGSLNGKDETVVETVTSIVKFFQQVDMLITQYDMKV